MEIIYIILIGGAIITLMKIFGKKGETTKEDEMIVERFRHEVMEQSNAITSPVYNNLECNIFHNDHDEK